MRTNREFQHESLRDGRDRGDIGGSVSTRLLEKGHEVIGLARSAEAAVALKQRGIEPLPGDINSYTPFVDVAKRVDAVINAANSDDASWCKRC